MKSFLRKITKLWDAGRRRKRVSHETVYAVIGTGDVYAFGIVTWKGLRIGNAFASGIILVQHYCADVEIHRVPKRSRFGKI